MFFICSGIILLQCLAVACLLFFRRKNPVIAAEHVVDQLSILVPMHNESGRIGKLINSLNQVDVSVKIELIFIDDHCTDQTVKTIAENLKYPYRVIANPYRKGKKRAILAGVNEAKSEFILTWDADISFSPAYWKCIQNLPATDFLSLPVAIDEGSIWSKWSRIEHSFLRLLQEGIAGLKRPILASGANLMFRKSAFLAVDQYRNDYEVGSGDDVFLLEAMHKYGYECVQYTDPAFQVKAAPPGTGTALIQQRKRWASKIGQMKQRPLIFPVILLTLVQLAFYSALFLCWEAPWFVVLMGMKFLVEWIILQHYYRTSFNQMLVLFGHQFLYPAYLLIGLLPAGKEFRWQQ